MSDGLTVQVVAAALYVWEAWNNEHISLPNAIARLGCVLEEAGFGIERAVPNPRVEQLEEAREFSETVRRRYV